MAPPSPRQNQARARIEALIRIAAPALDLLLAAGDRISRVADRKGADDPVPAIRLPDDVRPLVAGRPAATD